MAESGSPLGSESTWTPPASIEEARARARERFKNRLQAGERVGACGCGEDDPVLGMGAQSPAECVVGVRFRDSGRVYYFRPGEADLQVGDWVVVPTGRGEEAGRVVIAPHQVRRALLQGEIGAVIRRLADEDVGRMAAHGRKGAEAIRVFGERSRARELGAKPIAAEYSFDGSAVTVSYSVPDRERSPDSAALRQLASDLANDLGCRVELRQVGPRDEARLLGGLGRCGRTLCCSSWLPVFPEISMSMAKNQDLPLNPSKVSGVCGRLLCCLSYENEQYRQMKAVMPKLGQAIDTPGGTGQVISMHLLKELVTVRLDEAETEATFRCDELDLTPPKARESAPVQTVLEAGQPVPSGAESDADRPRDEVNVEAATPARRRRRRRSGRRGGSAS
jgi:cell fate regulator YaaT (PSP1 superfamily)